MLLLILYIFIALGFSFLCSIAEAVLLSVSSAYVALLEKQDKPVGKVLHDLKADVNKPLAAILTLNTIAHTVGAAGAGAQATKIFGDIYLGVISAVLTLLILIFSEIIPKTVGAHYWKSLAPITAHSLRVLIVILYPFVWFSERLTRGLTEGPSLRGFNRKEFMVMAEISAQEGQLAEEELKILKNLLVWRDLKVEQAMTPRTVIFSVSQQLTVADYFTQFSGQRFSRIPVYEKGADDIVGFVLLKDLLLANADDRRKKKLRHFRRDLPALLEMTPMSKAINDFIKQEVHIMLVVNEYGEVEGVLTLEDLLETLLGLEIIDEGDKVHDMQWLARRLAKRKAKLRSQQ